MAARLRREQPLPRRVLAEHGVSVRVDVGGHLYVHVRGDGRVDVYGCGRVCVYVGA